MPGSDLQLFQDFHESIPYLTSVLKNESKWARVETQSCRGFYHDLFVISEAKQVELVKQSGEIEDFLVSFEEMEKNGFPKTGDLGFIGTNELGTVQGVIALDCEMVKTTKGLELARVSLVSESGNVLYDEYVIPEFPVIDYLTQYSGITPALLQAASKTLEMVQKDFISLVNQNAILCGHSLDNDLRTIKIAHGRVADTSLLYPHNYVHKRLGLKLLAKKYLKRTIQVVKIN